MTPSTKSAHHHGNLRAALVQSGIEMLEGGEPFSLRAVARHVGVSQAAPYRHFADKEHLEAAMAAHGFQALGGQLKAVIERQDELPQLVDLALAYIRYAMQNPALYHLMFGQPCGENDERLSASASVFALIEDAAKSVAPEASSHGLATAGWALAHGLASLYLDGKLQANSSEELESQVRETFGALGALSKLSATPE